ncbi:antibiotic biosynthesis monooxygenase [Paenibacillus sp. LMG 31461]|uniref:Antibiotic biosynthesis monooxygenase n=1 Tax=Paenibacillus plantarum TaxID=2654975 RepID=A0ABX1XL05_9BACL|nr:putative quinol monooxygenase [Paenibacillus plantarum]NOU69131.1 antibiotic biosynthesis monooxygenase [Paenibacillus plantarum]
MIILQVQMTVKVEERDTFLNKANLLLAATQAEEGNISYNLYEDVSRPGSFAMLEEWRDEQAIDRHNKSEHFTEFLAYARNVLAEPAKMYRLNQ